jgi:hypothetical protein
MEVDLLSFLSLCPLQYAHQSHSLRKCALPQTTTQLPVPFFTSPDLEQHISLAATQFFSLLNDNCNCYLSTPALCVSDQEIGGRNARCSCSVANDFRRTFNVHRTVHCRGIVVTCPRDSFPSGCTLHMQDVSVAVVSASTRLQISGILRTIKFEVDYIFLKTCRSMYYLLPL